MRNCLFLLIFLSSVAFGQTNFSPGVIVTLSGDSIEGQVDDQLWRRNPIIVKFKDASGAERSYAPKEIKAFVVQGKVIYESHRVSYDSSSERINKLSFSASPSLKQATVFLKVIVKGNATLYRFVEDNDRIHYFLGKDGKVEELLNRQYIVNNQRQMNRLYLAQLDAAFRDCSSVKVKTTTRYDEGTLTKLFEKYAACKGSVVTKAKKEKTLIKFGVIATVAQDQFGGYPPYKPGIGYGGGAFVNFFLPGKFYKWSVYTELAYRKFGEQNASITPWHKSYATFFDISSLKFTAMGRDHFNIGKLRSFFNIGATYSGGIEDLSRIEAGTERPFSARFISGVAGVGVVLNHANKGPKCLIDARFEYGNGLDEYPTVTKHISIGLNLGVQF